MGVCKKTMYLLRTDVFRSVGELKVGSIQGINSLSPILACMLYALVALAVPDGT